MSYLPVETTADSGTLDQLHSALARESRRLVLAYFEHTGTETASLESLADYVVVHQQETQSTPKRAHIRLYHADLPMLADTDLIDYDAQTGRVRYRGAPAGVEAEEWSQYLAEGRVT